MTPKHVELSNDAPSAGRSRTNEHEEQTMTCEDEACARRIAELKEEIDDLESELFYLQITGSDD
jgi:hypothetical protein